MEHETFMSFVYLHLKNSNKLAIVDEEDFYKIESFNFGLNAYGYVMAYKGHILKALHKLLLKYDTDMFLCDHISGNKLDNRKCNLRICSAGESSRNRSKGKGKRPFKSKYKGVSKTNTLNWKWLARITFNKKTIELGQFDSEKEAAIVYNKAAIKYHKEFAKLNIIE